MQLLDHYYAMTLHDGVARPRSPTVVSQRRDMIGFSSQAFKLLLRGELSVGVR
jgi:hypothetical protein